MDIDVELVRGNIDENKIMAGFALRPDSLEGLNDSVMNFFVFHLSVVDENILVTSLGWSGIR